MAQAGRERRADSNLETSAGHGVGQTGGGAWKISQNMETVKKQRVKEDTELLNYTNKMLKFWDRRFFGPFLTK
ncbi:MAG: hypothetical protein HQL67_10960 [Magnetococcales bacterium]|nr:hypothetical protein [Magnetococcales bacterium]